MPAPESFVFNDDAQMMAHVYPFGFEAEDGTSEGPRLKDGGYMSLETGDSATALLDYAFQCSNSQQPGSHFLAVDESDFHPLSHRGSTSSSSSIQSAGSSDSPPPAETSPSEWFEDTRGNDAFDDDTQLDMEKYLELPESSPSPLGAGKFSPEPHVPSESVPPERAVKRRKAQPSKPTKQASCRSRNLNGKNSPSKFSPVSAEVANFEPSPTSLYPNEKNLRLGDGNFDQFGEVLRGPAMSQGWLPTTNGQVKDTLFAPPPSELQYIPPTNHDLSNGTLPASTSHSSLPRLVIHPMPLKSRVETQIPLKIILHNLPKGIKRVHLPTHTIAKPKLLEKPATGPSADMLELTTMLVCTSAMNDQARRDRAYAWAARKLNGNELGNPVDGLEDEESKPQNGGEVRICQGCIIRERKRAGRKKHKKPEEEELWDRYERQRAIVFNTQEVKEWQTVTPVMADPTGAGIITGSIPEGTVQVDAPMRIACYCRHHSEKLGFQVIITLKDYTGNVVAQGISTSIMITDDHKTPAQPGPTPTSTSQQPTQLEAQHTAHYQQSPPPPHSQAMISHGLPVSSQAGISQLGPTCPLPIQPRGLHPFQPNTTDKPSLPFRHTHSTPDMQTQPQRPPLNVPSGPHPNNSQSTTRATTPHNISPQTSPITPLIAGSRKRKASIVGKLPASLTMSKIETNQPMTTGPSNVQVDSGVVSAGGSPFTTNPSHMSLNGELSNQEQHMLSHGPQLLGAGPTTPNNSIETFVFPPRNHRPMNLKQFSAPASAHASRPPSPNQQRPEPHNLPHPQMSQDFNVEPQMLAPAILRIIPNEGSKCGGAEITVLGSNFTNDGLEVYFGGHRAITTTYWGPTSLVCMLPPSPKSGRVEVSIGRPGRRIVQQAVYFTYKDDDEDQLIRTALVILARHFGAVSTDPTAFARHILGEGGDSGNQASHAISHGTFNRFSLESGEAVETNLLRILEMMDPDDGPNRARINLRRSNGQTMLHLACSLGFVRFVAGLLSRGANVHIKDEGGFTALHMAAMNNHPEVVRRLIAKGADRDVLSRSGLTPMDVARSLSVRRYLQHIENDFRSRSVDSRRRSRASSRSSVRSLWEYSGMTPKHGWHVPPSDLDVATAADGDDSSEERTTEGGSDWLDTTRLGVSGARRRSTAKSTLVSEADEGRTSPSATMLAIREQVAAQLQQFQHTMAMHLQNLPQFQMPNIPQISNLPPMPVLPSYQAYLQSAPVMQRISSLVPNIRGQRQGQTDDHTSNHGDNRWGVFPFFGTKDSPPPYEELYPQEGFDMKQSSAAQAAADYEADAKCATLFDQDLAQTSHIHEVPQTPGVHALLQIGRKHPITKEQQETLQRAHAQRLKAGSSDKMLWFVWIPILVFVLGAMLWSGAPSFVSGTVSVVKTMTGLIANPRDIGNRVRNIVQELAL